MSGVNGKRCGYVHDVSTVPGVGETCCWRPVWNDADRCVWHADGVGKPSGALAERRPRPGERLDGARLRGTALDRRDWFEGCSLVGARFDDASLRGVAFDGADLREARIAGSDLRRATFLDANLERTEFVRTDLRFTSFDGARLHHVSFSDVHVNEATTFGSRLVYERELAVADNTFRRIELLEATIWTYRELKRTAEDSGQTGQPRRYYLREKDARRRLAWARRAYTHALTLEGSRLVTGYGSKPWRVVWASVVLILLCAVLYPVTGGIVETQQNVAITYTVEDPSEASPRYLGRVFFKSLYFSVVTFATLGYGDIQPIGPWARAIAGAEALLGQLLVALLVFVLTYNITWLE